MSDEIIPASEQVVCRLLAELQKCVDDCNTVYSMLRDRRARGAEEGRVTDDETAKSWLHIINGHFERAKLLHFIQFGFHAEDGSVPGIEYVPGPARYVGKTS